jgi:predicted DNA-binding transcriptional regulator AlpA
MAELQALLDERGFPSSRPAIYRLLDEGMPGRHQLIPRGRVRFDREAVLSWIDARCSEPAPGEVA